MVVSACVCMMLLQGLVGVIGTMLLCLEKCCGSVYVDKSAGLY